MFIQWFSSTKNCYFFQPDARLLPAGISDSLWKRFTFQNQIDQKRAWMLQGTIDRADNLIRLLDTDTFDAHTSSDFDKAQGRVRQIKAKRKIVFRNATFLPINIDVEL